MPNVCEMIRAIRGQPSCLHGHSALPRELSSRRRMLPIVLEKLSGVTEHHFHGDHGPHATALRSPASESRPTHWGRERRHRPGSPPLDGAWVAWRGVDGRALSGCGGPHRAGTPTVGPQATTTRAEAHGTSPARTGPAARVRVSPHWCATAGRTRQATNPARRGSGPRVSAVANAPAGHACVAKSVSCLVPPTARLCARRSVLLSADLPISTDAV